MTINDVKEAHLRAVVRRSLVYPETLTSWCPRCGVMTDIPHKKTVTLRDRIPVQVYEGHCECGTVVTDFLFREDS